MKLDFFYCFICFSPLLLSSPFYYFPMEQHFQQKQYKCQEISKFNSISRSSTTNLYIFKCFQYLVLSPKNLIASGNFWQKWHIVAEFFKTFQISPQI